MEKKCDCNCHQAALFTGQCHNDIGCCTEAGKAFFSFSGYKMEQPDLFSVDVDSFLRRIKFLEEAIKPQIGLKLSENYSKYKYDELINEFQKFDKRLEALEKHLDVLGRYYKSHFELMKKDFLFHENESSKLVDDFNKKIATLQARLDSDLLTKVCAGCCFESINLPGIKERLESIEDFKKQVSDWLLDKQNYMISIEEMVTKNWESYKKCRVDDRMEFHKFVEKIEKHLKL